MKLIDPKMLKGRSRIEYIVEVMAMRARGRLVRLEADRKRLEKKRKRAQKDWHKHMGVVDDEEYGEKPIQITLKEIL